MVEDLGLSTHSHPRDLETHDKQTILPFWLRLLPQSIAAAAASIVAQREVADTKLGLLHCLGRRKGELAAWAVSLS